MKFFVSIVITLLFFMSVGIAQNSSLYSIKLPSINGTDSINLGGFQGKKILLVNSATLASSINQLSSLEQLYQHFKDSSLIIIVCPSNSFGNEPGSDGEILQYVSNRFSPQFLMSAKIETTGNNAHSLYKWISSKEQNGVMNGKIKGDFTKLLINAQGEIVGLYSGQVDPQDPVIINAIRNN